MPLITYLDKDGSGSSVEWFGRTFENMTPVEVDAERDRALIDAAKDNPYFDVDESVSEAPAFDDTPKGRGSKAAEAGKKRSVPVAYRGKPEGEAWLAGWDQWTASNPPKDDDAEDETEVPDPLAQSNAGPADHASSMSQAVEAPKDAPLEQSSGTT